MVMMLPIMLPSFLFTIVAAIIFFNVLLGKQFVLQDLARFILRTDKYCRPLNISVELGLSHGLRWPNEEVPGPGQTQSHLFLMDTFLAGPCGTALRKEHSVLGQI